MSGKYWVKPKPMFFFLVCKPQNGLAGAVENLGCVAVAVAIDIDMIIAVAKVFHFQANWQK